MRFMPSDSVRLALFDIRDCILLARDFIKGLSYEAFKESRLHFFAVTRALEIISEASRRLPEELRNRHPDLPWRDIRDAGNMYRHGYELRAAGAEKVFRETASGARSDRAQLRRAIIAFLCRPI